MATPRTMRAVQYDKYGGGAEGLKHVEVPIPSPKKGEVLLKMEAASINPIDWKIQKGMLRPFLPGRFPFTPGLAEWSCGQYLRGTGNLCEEQENDNQNSTSGKHGKQIKVCLEV